MYTTTLKGLLGVGLLGYAAGEAFSAGVEYTDMSNALDLENEQRVVPFVVENTKLLVKTCWKPVLATFIGAKLLGSALGDYEVLADFVAQAIEKYGEEAVELNTEQAAEAIAKAAEEVLEA